MPLCRLIFILLLLAPAPAWAGEGGAVSRVRDLEDKAVRPLAATNATVVLIFASVDCPISNKQAPEVQRIVKKHEGKEMRMWLVYPDGSTSKEEVLKHLAEYGYECPAVLDPDHELVRIAGVKVTPEAAVFHHGNLVYRGRINDRHPALGVTRAAASSHDLENVLEALAEGQKVEFKSTPAIGCYIDPESRR